jgi:hypothetical protein
MNQDGPDTLEFGKGYHSGNLRVILKRSGSQKLLLRAGPGPPPLDRRKRSQRYTITGGESEGSMASTCCARGENGPNAALPICKKPAPYEEPTSDITTTSSNGC